MGGDGDCRNRWLLIVVITTGGCDNAADISTRRESEVSQYMLSVWHEDEYELDFESEDAQRRVGQVMEFNNALAAANALLFAGGLQPASTSRVMNPQHGVVSQLDGPFAETKEQMGGFWIIEAPDDDTATGWTRQAALACEQPVELRPLQG
jgi:hypothetical protein